MYKTGASFFTFPYPRTFRSSVQSELPLFVLLVPALLPTCSLSPRLSLSLSHSPVPAHLLRLRRAICTPEIFLFLSRARSPAVWSGESAPLLQPVPFSLDNLSVAFLLPISMSSIWIRLNRFSSIPLCMAFCPCSDRNSHSYRDVNNTNLIADYKDETKKLVFEDASDIGYSVLVPAS